MFTVQPADYSEIRDGGAIRLHAFRKQKQLQLNYTPVPDFVPDFAESKERLLFAPAIFGCRILKLESQRVWSDGNFR